MSTRIVGSNWKSALVIVDDQRVRVRWRRGRSPVMACDECGWSRNWDHCDHTQRALHALNNEEDE